LDCEIKTIVDIYNELYPISFQIGEYTQMGILMY